MAQLFAAAPDNNLPDVPNYNVCPTTDVHVVTLGDYGRRLRPMRWGFVPTWYEKPTGGPLLINARAETLSQKPAFRLACRQRRCLIPASGFYEWTKLPKGGRLPWYIFRKDEGPLGFAGIWQEWAREDQVVLTCAIVTVAASTTIKPIHNRMPLVLEAGHWGRWLGEEGKDASLLMKTPQEDRLSFHRVGEAVNSARARGATLSKPMEEF